jgi:hypothetical protein
MHELIAGIMDLIGQAHTSDEVTIVATAPEGQLSPLSISNDTEDLQRMRQIAGLLPSGSTEYANEPGEQYAGIEAVTTHAGGGVNGPKDPSDIRGEHPSMYPAHQHGFKE